MPDDLAAEARKQGLLPGKAQRNRDLPGAARRQGLLPPAPASAPQAPPFLPSLAELLGDPTADALVHGFLQGIPQGITAARNFATDPNKPPPRVPPPGIPPPTQNLNFGGGLPVGALGGLDLSGTAGAFMEGYRAKEPPPPRAVRNLFGEGTPQAVADYALDFLQPETGFALGPAWEATIGRGVTAAARGAKRLLTPALSSALGEFVSQKILHPFGLGATSQMMREVTRSYEQRVAVRLQEAGQIGREMRKELQGLRLADVSLDLRMKGLPETDPGPFQRLVQKYVVLNIQHGPQALPNSLDNQAIALRAQQEGIPYPLIERYGKRLLADLGQTIGDLQATGATPFVKARGSQFQVPKTPPPGAWYKNPYFAATPKSAKPLAEDKLRRKFASAYLDQLFASEKPQALGQVGAAAFTGQGIKEIRRAGLRAVVNRLVDPADVLSRYASAVYRPGFVQVKGLRAFGKPLAGKFLPEPLYRYLANEIGEAGLVGPAGQKVFTKYGRQAGPPMTSGQRFWAGLGTAAEKLAGIRKKTWIGNFATASSNILSNTLAVELAARREGFPMAAYLAQSVPAGAEVLAYKYSGRASADIELLRQYSRSFVETQGATAALAGKKGPRELAGLTGTVLRAPGGKGAVMLPAAQELLSRAGGSLASVHDYAEKSAKLALFKVLKERHGPEEAAKLVEKYLFDYSDRGFLLEGLDHYGAWVFNAFPTKAAALLLDTMVNRPDLIARYPRLQAQMFGEAPGAKERYAALAQYSKGPFVVPGGGKDFLQLGRLHPFGDALKTAQETGAAIRELRLPDFLEPEELANLPGRTMLSPEFELFQNRRQYGSTKHPVEVRPSGEPLETQIPGRIAEYGYSQAPGFVRALAEYAAARAGVPSRPGQMSEAREPLDVLLQGFLGLRKIPGETFLDKHERLRADPEKQQQAKDVRGYWVESRRYLKANPELNPFRASVMRMKNFQEVLTQYGDAAEYLRGQMGGPLTDEKKRNLDRAVGRTLALQERLLQLLEEQRARKQAAP